MNADIYQIIIDEIFDLIIKMIHHEFELQRLRPYERLRQFHNLKLVSKLFNCLVAKSPLYFKLRTYELARQTIYVGDRFTSQNVFSYNHQPISTNLRMQFDNFIKKYLYETAITFVITEKYSDDEIIRFAKNLIVQSNFLRKDRVSFDMLSVLIYNEFATTY